MQWQLDAAPVLQCLFKVTQVEQQAAEFIQRRQQQFVRRGRLARQPASDLGDAAAALRHRAVVRAVRLRRERRNVATRHEGRAGEIHRRRRHGGGHEGVDAPSPGPQVGRPARRQRDRIGVEPENKPGACFGRQVLAARVEGVPARCVEPARPADDVHHRTRAGVLDEAGFQHGHVSDLVAIIDSTMSASSLPPRRPSYFRCSGAV